MDQPAKPPSLVQPSIRSFFQPRQPAYAAPPSAPASNAPPKDKDERDKNKTKTDDNSTSTAPQATPPPLPTLSSIPTLPLPPFLPSNAYITPIHESHIPALRRINSLLLPVTYPDTFYTSLLTSPLSVPFSRSILWSDPPSSPSSPDQQKVIGSIICRLEPSSPSSGTLYIRSLALLSPYRGHGLASAALNQVLWAAQFSGADIRTVYAHVWTENRDGLEWYAARGFKREGTKPVEGYYMRLRPNTAWVVSREVMMPAARQGVAVSGEMNGGGEGKENKKEESVLAGAVNLPAFSAANGEEEEKKRQRPPGLGTSVSYQKARPETEWNDLPADMVAGNAGGGAAAGGPGRATHLSAPASGASSRSSSAARRKKDRAYPAAAFGS
jgi:ribosomal protein S18 acetylase RimI-like enzyme